MHYEILEKLGGSATGVVYKAEDTRSHRVVALKFLPPDAANPRTLARFKRDALAATALNHPNICPVFEVGEEDGHAFVAMELLTGSTIKHRLEDGPLSPETAINLSMEVAAALTIAHSRELVHGGLNPSTVFLTSDGHIKILDFGLGHATANPEKNLKPRPGAAPPATNGAVSLYASPELLTGKPIDVRTDLFALGVLLYEMAAGAPPFTGETPAEISDAILKRAPVSASRVNPGAPPDFDRVINKALQKDPDTRYQNASRLHADLKFLKHDLAAAVRYAPPAAAPPRTSALPKPPAAQTPVPPPAKTPAASTPTFVPPSSPPLPAPPFEKIPSPSFSSTQISSPSAPEPPKIPSAPAADMPVTSTDALAATLTSPARPASESISTTMASILLAEPPVETLPEPLIETPAASIAEPALELPSIAPAVDDLVAPEIQETAAAPTESAPAEITQLETATAPIEGSSIETQSIDAESPEVPPIKAAPVEASPIETASVETLTATPLITEKVEYLISSTVLLESAPVELPAAPEIEDSTTTIEEAPAAAPAIEEPAAPSSAVVETAKESFSESVSESASISPTLADAVAEPEAELAPPPVETPSEQPQPEPAPLQAVLPVAAAPIETSPESPAPAIEITRNAEVSSPTLAALEIPPALETPELLAETPHVAEQIPEEAASPAVTVEPELPSSLETQIEESVTIAPEPVEEISRLASSTLITPPSPEISPLPEPPAPAPLDEIHVATPVVPQLDEAFAAQEIASVVAPALTEPPSTEPIPLESALELAPEPPTVELEPVPEQKIEQKFEQKSEAKPNEKHEQKPEQKSASQLSAKSAAKPQPEPKLPKLKGRRRRRALEKLRAASEPEATPASTLAPPLKQKPSTAAPSTPAPAAQTPPQKESKSKQSAARNGKQTAKTHDAATITPTPTQPTRALERHAPPAPPKSLAPPASPTSRVEPSRPERSKVDRSRVEPSPVASQNQKPTAPHNAQISASSAPPSAPPDLASKLDFLRATIDALHPPVEVVELPHESSRESADATESDATESHESSELHPATASTKAIRAAVSSIPLPHAGPSPHRNLIYTAGAIAIFALALALLWHALSNHVRPVAPSLTQRQLTNNPPENRLLFVGISSDGRHLAFSDPHGLHLSTIDSGAIHDVPLPDEIRSHLWDVAWFPDGEKLLLVSQSDSDGDVIWATSIFGDTPRKLRTHAKRPVISPDGASIAFITGSGNTSASTSAATAAAASANANTNASPNAPANANPAYSNAIWLMGANGENPHALTSSDKEIYTTLAWSPAGSRIAYERTSGYANGGVIESIALTAPDQKSDQKSPGSQKSAGPSAAVISNPKLWSGDIPGFLWLPDGRVLFLVNASSGTAVSDRDFATFSIPVDPQTGVPSAKAVKTSISGFAVSASADAKRLITIRLHSREDVWLADLQDNATKLKAIRPFVSGDPSRDSNDYPTAWAPDGKTILFSSDRTGPLQIFKQSLDDAPAPNAQSQQSQQSQAALQPLFKSPDTQRHAIVTPDASYILYWSFPPANGASLPSKKLMRALGPAASAAASQQNSQQPQQVLETSLDDSVDFLCPHDTSGFCVLRRWDDNQMFFYTLDPLRGQGQQLGRIRMILPQDDLDWDVSPNAARVALSSPSMFPGQIRLLDLRTGNDSTIQLPKDWHVAAVNWTPSGDALFLNGESNSSYFEARLDLNGKSHILLERPKIEYLGPLISSPDGRHVAFYQHFYEANAWVLENF